MAKQLKKYMAVTTASLMAMQLAACGNTESQTVEETSATSANTNNSTEENNISTVGDDLQSVYDSEMANGCAEWKESDDGSFECLDENSPHYAHHFFNGLMYATTGAMIGSAIYKSRNLKNGTDREKKSGGSSGFAAPRTTHSNTSESKHTNSNGITTDGTQPTSDTTSSGTKSSTSNNSNSSTSGSNSYSSGQRSYSNNSGSSTNNTNSYSNSSSSNTGKTGFGSGGASRGGSSSS